MSYMEAMPSIDESHEAAPLQLQPQQRASFLLNHADSFGDEWSHFLGEEDDEVQGAASSGGDSQQHHHYPLPSSSAAAAALESPTPRNMIIELPPQLHPAVSEGMRKISSCYFSVRSTSSGNNLTTSNSYSRNGSLADIFSFLDCDEESLASMASQNPGSSADAAALAEDTPEHRWDADQDLLYHDILMNVFGFLDADSLAAFSETARRPNFEVFYYIQLQLQRAVLPGHGNGNTNGILSCGLSPMSGMDLLTRLSNTDRKAAEQTVKGYLDSNASLRQMPLSHSLEYIRQVFLMRLQPPLTASDMTPPTSEPGSELANSSVRHPEQPHHDASLFPRAALLIALIGAASYTMNTETLMVNMDAFMPPAAELPNMLFRMGFLGSLMSAARSFTSKDGGRGSAKQNASRNTMKQQAEQFGRNMMQAFFVVLQEEEENQRLQEERDGQLATQHSATSVTAGVRAMMLRMMRAAYLTAYGYEHQRLEDGRNGVGGRRNSRHLFSPDPYDHLPPLPPSPEGDEENDDNKSDNDQSEELQIPKPPSSPDPSKGFGEEDSNISEITTSAIREKPKRDSPANPKLRVPETVAPPCKKTPTGCVGAYRRAISQVSKRLVEMVKEDRLKKYKALSEEEQRRLGTALVDACADDDGLQEVKNIVNQGIDVEDFYVASDGTETSALHAAAAHGAVSILEYLLRQTGPTSEEDGGLCQVNLKDSNGWTALHFAAGTQSTKAIRVLGQHGADLTVEAANGYTPLHWAIRLQNTAVAEELRLLLAERTGNGAFHHAKRNHATTWPSPPDLSRFFFGGAMQSHG